MSRPLRLGHITYSNCLPVHAGLIERPEDGDPVLVPGIPSTLNALLAAGEIDAAPCSSIEFARHAAEYLVLPDLAIGCRGPVGSILLLGDRAPREMDGALLALPTASATSVVLLRILFRRLWGAAPREIHFDQGVDDPFALGADAALFIGDPALHAAEDARHASRVDLGEAWAALTGLPFAFAVWQARRELPPEALARLHRRLLGSLAYGAGDLRGLANRHAGGFGLRPELLAGYWRDLSYRLDPPMLEGLRTFYRLAREIGEIPRAPRLRWARI